MWKYGFAVLAFLIAAVLAFLEPRQFLRKSRATHVVAYIVATEGKVQSQAPRELEWQSITANQGLAATGTTDLKDAQLRTPLNAQELLETDADGSATIEFPDGLKIKLNADTRVVADFEAGSREKIQVSILRGNVEILATGAKSLTTIFKDGHPIQPQLGSTDTAKNPLITSPAQPPPAPQASDEPAVAAILPEEPVATATPDDAKPPKTLPSKEAAKTDLSNNSLSNDEITAALAGQSPRFQRCYLGWMNRSNRRKPEGMVFVAFSILNSGKVASTRLVRSPFDDKTLHDCLLEVVSRTSFPSFEGETILVSEFPLSVE